jgi:hypothetical protein
MHDVCWVLDVYLPTAQLMHALMPALPPYLPLRGDNSRLSVSVACVKLLGETRSRRRHVFCMHIHRPPITVIGVVGAYN